ncbi:MAG: BamA/TamA family outer membrane protein [Cytophagales bacterium]|nr:BamA/TamA family outer membrane protein [Cytophagales bacterium]
MGHLMQGLGPAFLYDDRQNPLNPGPSRYASISLTYFEDHLGDNHDFVRLHTDLRRYLSVGQHSILATQLLTQLNYGEVPFRLLPELGGHRLMRGYYEGRYRDRHYMALQSELRMPLVGRLGLVVFGAGGAIGQQLSFHTSQLKGAFGAGLRFKYNRKQNVNVRLDYGISSEMHGFYIILGEAF